MASAISLLASEIETDKFAGQRRKALDFLVGRSDLYDHVLTIDVAVCAQSLIKGVEDCTRLGRFKRCCGEKTYPRDFLRLPALAASGRTETPTSAEMNSRRRISSSYLAKLKDNLVRSNLSIMQPASACFGAPNGCEPLLLWIADVGSRVGDVGFTSVSGHRRPSGSRVTWERSHSFRLGAGRLDDRPPLFCLRLVKDA
jgi:hypothetical protein